jgi:hypothetical protein
MVASIALSVIIGSAVFLAGRSLFRNMSGKVDSRGCGMEGCYLSGR